MGVPVKLVATGVGAPGRTGEVSWPRESRLIPSSTKVMTTGMKAHSFIDEAHDQRDEGSWAHG